MDAFDLVFDDLDTFESFVTETYSRIRMDGTSARTSASVSRQVLTAEVGLDDIRYGFDMSFESVPDDQLMVISTTEGRIASTNGGADDSFGVGDAFLLNLPGTPYSGRVHGDSRYDLAVIDPALLRRVLGGAHATGEPVTFLDHRPVSADAGRLVHAVLAQLRQLLALPAVAPLLRESAAQYLAAVVLDSFPTEAAARPGPAAQPASVRRAVAYVEAHAADPITVGDIAVAAGVTPRALQLGFRQHLGCSPMGYLRRVRLDLARRELLAGSAATVAEVAAAWGFGNQGRFAAAYRTAYGETPAATLRAVRN